MIIQLNQVSLRTITGDNPETGKIADDLSVARFLTEKRLYPSPMPENITFTIESDGETIGEIALKNIRWYNRKAELSLFIKPSEQGKNIGFEVLHAIMKYAFFTLNFYRLEAEIIEYNDRAIRLIEKLNFKQEGRLREAKYWDGKYYDILNYGILKSEFSEYQSSNNRS